MLLSLKILVDQQQYIPSVCLKVTDESTPARMTNAPGGPHLSSDHSLKNISRASLPLIISVSASRKCRDGDQPPGQFSKHVFASIL